MRTKYRSNQLQMDDAIAKAEHFQELLEVLQKSKQSELSDRLIAMSERIQSMRLNEMRAVRELNEVKEKNDYLARLLRASTDNVKKLEEKCAEMESKMMKREEEFRRADNERMRKFFNARFDDIPSAFQANTAAVELIPTKSIAGSRQSQRRVEDEIPSGRGASTNRS